MENEIYNWKFIPPHQLLPRVVEITKEYICFDRPYYKEGEKTVDEMFILTSDAETCGTNCFKHTYEFNLIGKIV